MKLLIRLNIILFVLFSGRLLAQQRQVPIKKIPVKSKQALAKDSLARADSAAFKDTTTLQKQWKKKQVDVTDVIEGILKIKPNPKVDTVSSKPSFSVVPAIGYTLVSKLAVVLSGNVAFRTGPESKISAIVVSSSITQRRQFTLPIQSNIWSKDNKYNFVGDFRFYKYPQSTYGLGSSSNITHEDPMDYSYVRIYETILRRITGNLYAGGGYIIDNHWNISDDGYFNDYASYGKLSHSIASGFTLNAVLDSRDSEINPSKGGYASVQYRDNFSFLGSTSNWSSLILDARRYINFPEGSPNILALWSFDWLILDGRPAFLDLPATQWDSFSATGRGYIQGRFRGADMVYAEAEYRYRILDNGLLGGVFFLNAQSLSAAPGTRLQGIQPGFGPGLRIKLNTISKTNIAIDYGFGRQGSNGLFIDVGEIF